MSLFQFPSLPPPRLPNERDTRGGKSEMWRPDMSTTPATFFEWTPTPHFARGKHAAPTRPRARSSSSCSILSPVCFYPSPPLLAASHPSIYLATPGQPCQLVAKLYNFQYGMQSWH
eukprot:754059-Hanusia_phi.AAC.1